MKQYKSGGTFVERDMFESPAYLSLKGFAPQLLIIVLGKRKFDNHGRKGKEKRVCTNCDKLHITYTEFKNEYGISQPRMTRALDELLAKGFLSIRYQGGRYREDKTVYSLSTNWVIWKQGSVFESRLRETVKRGFCHPKKQLSHT